MRRQVTASLHIKYATPRHELNAAYDPRPILPKCHRSTSAAKCRDTPSMAPQALPNSRRPKQATGAAVSLCLALQCVCSVQVAGGGQETRRRGLSRYHNVFAVKVPAAVAQGGRSPLQTMRHRIISSASCSAIFIQATWTPYT